MTSYTGIISSDWSECLSPSGPFDMITFHYPHLRDAVADIFKGYTGNAITLVQTVAQIREILPSPMGKGQLDAYLREGFDIYPGAAALMEWCRQNDILFMINSTGAIGYFQRIFALGLVPTPDALAAGSMVRFEPVPSDPATILVIEEISDKPRHSAAMAQRFQIPHDRIVVIGDSGGDGPHFEWGAGIGATLIASLAKPSLLAFCRSRNITIQHHWNPHPSGVNCPNAPAAMGMDLKELLDVVRCVFGR